MINSGEMMKKKSIAMLVVSALSSGYVHAKNYTTSSDVILPFNQINERYFVSNNSTNPVNIVVENGLTVNSEGSFHLGFSGKTDTQAGSIASGDINMLIDGNLQVYNDTWLGKFNTKFFTEKANLHLDFPYDRINNNIDVHVKGDINVAIGPDKERGGLMIIAGSDIMDVTERTPASVRVRVDGDTNIYSGDNHLSGSKIASAKLITRSFNLTGGDIEIIGSKTVLETTNTDANKASVLVGKTGKMIIMRGGTVDVTQGNFNVVDEGILSASKGNGFVKLSANSQLNIDRNATIESNKGSLSISDRNQHTSQLNIAGIINFGVSDAKQMNKISGDVVDVKSSARFTASEDFIRKGLSYTDSEANAVVLAGNTSLQIAGMKEGETRSLISNIYGDLNFKLSGNELKFVNATNVADFTDDQQAKAAANRQLSNYYQKAGFSSKNVAKGFALNLAKVSDASWNHLTRSNTISSDASPAGNLNWAILDAIGRGNFNIANGGMQLQFNQALAGLYNNNRGLHISEIALNSFNDTKALVDKRTHQFYQSENSSDNDDNLWVNFTHHYENTDNQHGISGYKYSSNGIMLGYDKAIFDNLLIGAAIGYNTGEYKDKAASSNDSDIKNYQLQFYSSYKFPTNVVASAYAGYTYGKNELKANDGYYSTKEKFHSNTWNVGGAVGYHWQSLEQLTLTPTIGLAYIYTENSAHDVRYNQIDLLNYGEASNSALLVPIDVSADYTVFQAKDTQLSLKTKLGYTFNLTEDEFDGDIHINGVNGLTKMKAHTSDRGKHQFNLGGGMSYQYSMFDVDIDYQYFGQSKRDTHQILATAKMRF